AASRINRLTDFWRKPDGEQPFATWLREALEDVLVLDAPAFEVRRNRAGDIIGLDIVDGSTIKVLTDDTGRRPKSPAPAYEQIIHGRPWRLLTSDDLIYIPRNPRPHKAYGFGPVGQHWTAPSADAVAAFHGGQHPAGPLECPGGLEPRADSSISRVVRLDS